MGFGRRDYTGGSIAEGGSVGRFSNNFTQIADIGIATMDIEVILDYTVPAGYYLYLTGWVVSTQSPVIQWAALYKDDWPIFFNWFILQQYFNIGNMGTFVFEAGSNLKIRGYNYDEKTYQFVTSIFGVLEKID
uniref:Uncharacterized protein n=1 Tax=viral metagenome TaxID=1070528 RepID=A0A6H1ZSU8_9ZZZZ